MDHKSKVIAIDGPSGSGKSTIAKILATNLKLIYLDTGAMFRGIAYHLHSIGIKSSDQARITEELAAIDFEYAKSRDILISINGHDLSQKIREHAVSALASEFSQVPVVRNYLKQLQRDIATKHPSILEGRDIGTVIFPDAELKFFLTADGKIRAQRRLEQLQEKDPNSNHSLESILEDILLRDKKDAERDIAPLVKADDAIEIDTTSLSIDQVVHKISQYFQKKQSLFQ